LKKLLPRATRAALRGGAERLEAEGLVETTVFGTTLTKVTMFDLHALYMLRLRLEPAVAYELARLMRQEFKPEQKAAVIRQLRKAAVVPPNSKSELLDAETRAAFFEADLEFHTLLSQLSSFKVVAPFIRRAYILSIATLPSEMLSNTHARQICREHEEVVAAICNEKKTPRDAAKLMAIHLASAYGKFSEPLVTSFKTAVKELADVEQEVFRAC
jgi:DNA-binding GntR family transcriptional regulator